MTNEKRFPKTISQWEFDYGLFTNLSRIIVACDFSPSSNSEEVSYLSWQNTYPNLKTTSHIKLKFFLWTKLLENLLLAKYLICIAVTLRRSHHFKDSKKTQSFSEKASFYSLQLSLLERTRQNITFLNSSALHRPSQDPANIKNVELCNNR